MRVALVHDFLLEYGGAERVLEVLHEMFPEAPVYTALYNPKKMGEFGKRFEDWDIRPSFMQKHWITRRFYSPLRWMAPWAWESFNFDEYEVVISSSAPYFAHGIITRPETKHICYMHTVPRYLYGYKTKMNWQKYWLTRQYGRILGLYLRQYDFLAAQRVDQFVVNSKFTQDRVKKFYRRDSIIVYPPVEVGGFSDGRVITKNTKSTKNTLKNLDGEVNHRIAEGTESQREKYFICVGRLVSSKHVDLVIKAANKLRVKLKIVGDGLERKELEGLAGGTVEFLGSVSDEELSRVYAGAKALVFASEEEDFGIVPVEAMGHGVPVVAYKSGGVPETVIQDKTGVLFGNLTVDSIAKAMELVEKRNIDPRDCVRQAKKFSKQVFVDCMRKLITESQKNYMNH